MFLLFSICQPFSFDEEQNGRRPARALAAARRLGCIAVPAATHAELGLLGAGARRAARRHALACTQLALSVGLYRFAVIALFCAVFALDVPTRTWTAPTRTTRRCDFWWSSCPCLWRRLTRSRRRAVVGGSGGAQQALQMRAVIVCAVRCAPSSRT